MILRDIASHRNEPEDTWAPRLLWEARVDEWGRRRPWKLQGRVKARWFSEDIDADSDCFSHFSRQQWY